MTLLIIEWALSWLWQGCLLTLVVAGVLRVTTRASAATRFLAWWATLAAVLFLGVASIVGTLNVSAPRGTSPQLESVAWPATTPYPSYASTPTTPLFPVTLPALPSWLGLALATGWLGFVGVRSFGFVVSLRHLRCVKRTTLPLPDDIERNLPWWQQVRERGRRTELRLSGRVATAAMLGLGSPIIAVPPRLVDSISRTDLDRIVIHEYGHVQRRDDWAIVGQALIDALFGWHPAIWWIGRQLQLEREVASDDWVARHTSAPREYASCLARVAELALSQRHVLHAASAVRSRRELRNRVERLLDPDRNLTSRPARLALTAGTVALGGTIWLIGLVPPLVGGAFDDLIRPIPAAPFVAVQPLPAAPVGQRVTTFDALAGPVRAARSPHAPPNRAPRVEIRATSLPLGATMRPPRTATRLTSTLQTDQSPLQSNQLRIDGRSPVSLSATRTLGLHTESTASNDDTDSAWAQVTRVGKAVGKGATEAGQATASAFQVLGSRFTRVFSGG